MAKTFQRINENVFKLQEDLANGVGGNANHMIKDALTETIKIMEQAAVRALDSGDEMKMRRLATLFDKFALILEQSGY